MKGELVMAIKLNEVKSEEKSFVKINEAEELGGKRKLFQNKTANKILIILGVVIAVVIIGCVIMININLPWRS